MTKLEEKLIELGYEYYGHTYYYKLCGDHIIYIDLRYKSQIQDYYVEAHYWNFKFQKQIDTLQQAFNEMQKDLEILKECEEHVD